MTLAEDYICIYMYIYIYIYIYIIGEILSKVATKAAFNMTLGISLPRGKLYVKSNLECGVEYGTGNDVWVSEAGRRPFNVKKLTSHCV